MIYGEEEHSREGGQSGTEQSRVEVLIDSL
jgi:hypothetical protein